MNLWHGHSHRSAGLGGWLVINLEVLHPISFFLALLTELLTVFPECVTATNHHEANEQEHLHGAKAIETTLGEPLDEGISADGAMHRELFRLAHRPF